MLYPPLAVERAMKVKEVILRALNKEYTWLQAAEILGISARGLRRLRHRPARVHRAAPRDTAGPPACHRAP